MRGQTSPLDYLDGAITFVRAIVEQWPDASGSEVLAELEKQRQRYQHHQETATCARCGEPIVRHPGAKRWIHDVESLSRGCRAASFDRLGTWDEALDRQWMATPAR